MSTRVALLGILVENPKATAQLNALLHENASYIIGRMGIPYPQKQISIISVALDAPQNVISSLAGKLGQLPGLSVKTIYTKAETVL